MVPNTAVVAAGDDALRASCAALLTDLGFAVTTATDGRGTLGAVMRYEPSLVMIGDGLADVNRDALLRALRERSEAFLVVVDADEEPLEQLRLLRQGADDVLPRPFSPHRLRSRLDTLMRRPRMSLAPATHEARRFEDLVIDVEAREVTLDDSEVELTKIEFDLLSQLSAAPRRVLTRERLIEAIWGYDWFGDDHMLEVHMGNLRRKLGESGRDPHFIETVRGVGYRFNPAPTSKARTKVGAGATAAMG
jgi:DNA-binding response OmpR family regulator